MGDMTHVRHDFFICGSSTRHTCGKYLDEATHMCDTTHLDVVFAGLISECRALFLVYFRCTGLLSRGGLILVFQHAQVTTHLRMTYSHHTSVSLIYLYSYDT